MYMCTDIDSVFISQMTIHSFGGLDIDLLGRTRSNAIAQYRVVKLWFFALFFFLLLLVLFCYARAIKTKII